MMSPLSFAAVFLLFIQPGWTLTEETFELRMPSIVPTQKDAYLCYSFAIPDDETWYITSIGPVFTDAEAVHHISLTAWPRTSSCPPVDSESLVWNCGEMLDESFASDIMCLAAITEYLYDWTKDVPEYHLPTGLGFKVGGHGDYQVLIVQIHYSDVSRFDEDFRDRTGVKITFTRERTPLLAALQSFNADGVIPSESLMNIEFQCAVRLADDTTLRVVSYQVHTHELGLLVTDYRVRDGVWTEIGQRCPQLPKELVPTDVTLQDGDIVVLRCLYYNDRDHAVPTGETHHNEMCITRLVFYAENGDFLRSFECDELDASDYATMPSR